MRLFDYLYIFLSSFGSSIPMREHLFLMLFKLRHSTSFDFLVHMSGIHLHTSERSNDAGNLRKRRD